MHKDPHLAALYLAAENGHLGVVKTLLANNLTPNVNVNGKSPLYIACANNHSDVVKVLLENKADPNFTNNSISSPLKAAAQEGYNDLVQQLINAGASLEDFGTVALFQAAANGHINVARTLLSKKVDPNAAFSKITPLFIACANNHPEIAKLYIGTNSTMFSKSTDQTRNGSLNLTERFNVMNTERPLLFKR